MVITNQGPWLSISHSDKKSWTNSKMRRFMRSSSNHLKLCRLLLMLMVTIFVCMEAFHQSSSLSQISILSIDTLSHLSMVSFAISSGPIQWMTAKLERFASVRTFKESVPSNSDSSQSKRSYALTILSLSFVPIRFKSMATRCTAGEATKLSRRWLLSLALQIIAVSIIIRELLFWSRTIKWTLSNIKMLRTHSTCQEKWIFSNGVFLSSWKRSVTCWSIWPTGTLKSLLKTSKLRRWT